jgi:TP901 family phage tail tape measure protein
MATRTISTRLAIEGESEYKQKLAEVNNSLKTMGSEMALLESKYRENANSLEALTAKGELLSREQETRRQKVASLQSALENARAAEQKYADQVSAAKEKVAGAERALEELKRSTGDTTTQQKALSDELKKYQEELKKAEQYQSAAGRGVEDWKRQLNYAQRDLNELDAEVQRNNRYLDEARQSADGCASSIDRFGREVRDAGDDSDDFGQRSSEAVDTLASALAAAGVAATIKEISSALMDCVDAAVTFENSMAEVFTLLPDSTAQAREKMSADMLQFSSDMNVLTEDAVPALYQAISAGVPDENVFAFMEVAQKAAVGGVTELKTSVDGLTSIVNAYGSANLSAQETADMLFTAVKLGKTDFTQLASSIYNVVPLAAASGVKLNDIAAALAAITAKGTPTSVATTQLRQVLAELTKEGSQVDKIFKEIAGEGFTQFVAAGGNLQDALQLLEKKAASSNVSISNMFSSVEAGQAALSLTGSGTQKFTEALEAMENSAGAVDAAYETMADTAEYQSQRAQTAFGNLKISIGTVLMPTFKQLSSTAADSLKWTDDLIKQHPWIIQALTAVTIGIGTLAAGVAGYTLVTNIAAAVQTAFNTAIGATIGPIMLVGAALATLIAAIALFSTSTDDATARTKELTKSVQESREAFQETADGIKESKDNTLDLVSALESAMAEEEKTAASKAVILELVEQLNEAVPDLALAYDEETDSLISTADGAKVTADALRTLVEAEAERQMQAENFQRLVDLKKQEQELDRQLVEAEDALTAAKERQMEASGIGMSAGYGYAAMVNSAAKDVSNAQKNIDALTEEQEKNRAEAEELEAQYNSYTESVKGATDASKGQEEQTQDTTATLEELTKASKEVTGVTEALAGAQDNLSAALKEQQEKGSLSLDTTLDLIDAGYAAALSIDEETGAITLNKDAYIAITKAKIEEQITTLEAQQASVNAAIDLRKEAYQATETAVGYLELARARRAAKAEASDKELNDLKAQSAAYDAQIASLKAAQKSLGSYSGAVASSARVSSSASRKVKTQAEQDLEAFKGIQAELKHSLDMGEITNREYYTALHDAQQQYLNDPANLEASRRIDEEIHKYNEGLETYQRLRGELEHELKVGAVNEEEYYRRLAKLRDDYLTDDSALEVLEERGKVSEELYSLEQDRLKQYGDHLKAALADYQSQIDSLEEEYMDKLAEVQDAMDDIQKEQDAMKSKLSGYGDLFTIDDRGNLHLEDLEKQRKAVENYGKVLEDLKAKGINGELLNEILGMDIDDATVFGNKLLKMGDKEWDSYNQAYQDKQDEAIRIAKEFYQEQMDELETEYNGILDEALGTLEQTAFDSGTDTISGLIRGMKEKEDEAAKEAARIAGAIEAKFRGMRLEVGPIGVNTPEVDGSHAGGLSYVPYDGYLAELHKGERVLTADEAKAFIAASMPRRYDVPQQGGGQMAQLQGMMQTVLQNQAARQESNTPIQLEAVIEMDGEVVARKQLTYNRRAERLQGKSFVDRG